MRKRFLILFTPFVLSILLYPFILFSQSKHPYRVSFFHTFNTEKLSKDLTAGLNSDSEKIVAIHTWITHHIRYDVKKFQQFDYTHLNTKKVLRKRKATCVGYTDLFNELCEFSHIKSVSVPGYVKNVYVDLGDKFYQDEHVWNAVFESGNWKLVDACWDAGFIDFTKRTVVGKILRVISFGRWDQVKCKPHFVKQPTEFYFLKSGSRFKTDHLPANPMWQLLQSPMSISQFENDSSYYLRKYELGNDFFHDEKISLQQEKYFSEDEEEKMIEDGFKGNTFNSKNNYGIAISYFLTAQKESKNIDTDSKDTLLQILICDSVISKLEKASRYFSLNDSLLKIQKQELINNNNRKRKIFSDKSGAIYYSLNKVLRIFKHYESHFKNSIKSDNDIKATFKRRIKFIVNDDSYYKIHFTSGYKVSDSIALISQLKEADDSISKLLVRLENYKSSTDSVYFQNASALRNNLLPRGKVLTSIASTTMNRNYFFDDLDNEIIVLSNLVICSESEVDSLIFIHDTSLAKYFYLHVRSSRQFANDFYNMSRTKINLLKSLKRICGNNPMILKNYETTKDSLIQILQSYIEKLDEWKDESNTIKILSKALYRLMDSQKKLILQERKVESMNSKFRVEFISARAKSFLKINQQSKRSSDSLKRSVISIRNKFAGL